MAFLYPWGNTQQLNLDWILQKIKELEAGTGGADLDEVAEALLAASYSAQAYDRSDIVFHDGKLYRANQAIPAPGEAWTPAHWDEILLGDTVSNLVQYVAALNNNQIVNSSNVAGAHTSDALNNLKTDLDDVTEELDNTLENKTAVDLSAATQGKYISYPDGTVYDNADYQVLRHVILEKGQTIYVTTYATQNVAPLSLEISGPVMQPLCQGTNSTSNFYYTANDLCQITVCTNFVETYTCYIAGAFVGLTDGVNDLYVDIDKLNGAITSVETNVGGTVAVSTAAGLISKSKFFNATANIALGSTGVTLEQYSRGAIFSNDGSTGSIVAVDSAGAYYYAFFSSGSITKAQKIGKPTYGNGTNNTTFVSSSTSVGYRKDNNILMVSGSIVLSANATTNDVLVSGLPQTGGAVDFGGMIVDSTSYPNLNGLVAKFRLTWDGKIVPWYNSLGHVTDSGTTIMIIPFNVLII